jgi:uncharacterized membrane protein
MALNQGVKMIAETSGGPNLLTLVLSLAILAGWFLNIAGLYRAVKSTDENFRLIGKTRRGQIGLHIFGIFLAGVGVVVGFIWFFVTKNNLTLKVRLVVLTKQTSVKVA